MCYVHTLIGAAEVLLYSRTGHAATSSRGRRRLLAAPESPYLLGCPMPLRVANARLFFSLLTEIDWEASLPAKGNITLFVPLDSALAKLGQASLSIGASPAMRATFLRALGAHIVPSPLRASDLINRTVLDTISGLRLQLRQLSGGKKQLWAVDGNTQASIISVDTEFCRGWIHIVDDTLFDMGVFSEVSSGCNQANVLTKAKAYPQLTTFLDMVARAGIAADIANSLEPLTIFAPINSAYWQGVNLSDGNAIARLLQEHIVHGLYSEYDLVNNATMFTLAETFLNGYADADGRLFIMRADGRGSRVLPGATAESCNHALFQLSQPLSAQLRAALPATLANMTSGLPSTASNPNPKVPIALPLMATKIPTAQPPTVAIRPATTRLPSKLLPTRMPSNLPTLRPVSLAPVCVPLETLLASRSEISSFTSALRARLASSARMPQRPFTILAPRNEAFSFAMADSQNVWRLSCAALVFAPSLACLFVCFFACLLACSFVCWFRCVFARSFARSLRALVRPFDGQDSLQASLLEPYIIQGRWTTSEMLETVWDPTFTFATTPRCHAILAEPHRVVTLMARLDARAFAWQGELQSIASGLSRMRSDGTWFRPNQLMVQRSSGQIRVSTPAKDVAVVTDADLPFCDGMVHVISGVYAACHVCFTPRVRLTTRVRFMAGSPHRPSAWRAPMCADSTRPTRSGSPCSSMRRWHGLSQRRAQAPAVWRSASSRPTCLTRKAWPWAT
jgi:uncharacterized surface protein with fasciclin (FAS1) repeats